MSGQMPVLKVRLSYALGAVDLLPAQCIVAVAVHVCPMNQEHRVSNEIQMRVSIVSVTAVSSEQLHPCGSTDALPQPLHHLTSSPKRWIDHASGLEHKQARH